MDNILLVIFFLSVYLILHSYLFYPLWLIFFTSQKKKNAVQFNLNDELPTVAILMAAYNEEKVIGEKIKSVFDTTYPKQKITFYIGSDASTDNTGKIITGWQEQY